MTALWMREILIICFAVNAIIPLVYIIIYQNILKNMARGKEIQVPSKILLAAGLSISMIALILSIRSIYYY